MPIKALIVDDEQLARDEMKYLLDSQEAVQVVGEAGGGEEAVRMVRELNPDLLFLDIQMPVMDGFKVVQTLLQEDRLPLIVFTTAYDQYAIKAFEVNAVDYLLKPIDKNRLEEAIERSRKSLTRPGEYRERIRKLTENIKVQARFLPRIVLRREGRMDLMEVEKIALLRREGRGVKAHTDEGDLDTNYADIDEIETQLDPKIFIRLGGDYLVNIEKIAQIVPWSGGHYLLTLLDRRGTEVRLSRSQAQLLKNKVEGIF
ncbi:MAG: response regulator transcription factor [Candidatus Krumholzibacteriota bacterium]|nr:response regulator transcription factor [Candidatus Krumholzibacteriota bacterium]